MQMIGRAPWSAVITAGAFICLRDETVTRVDGDGASIEAQPVLNVPVTCVGADGDCAVVGTGALRSSDGGRRREHIELPDRDVVSILIGRADGTLYAGTEPGRLVVLRDAPHERSSDAPGHRRPAYAGDFVYGSAVNGRVHTATSTETLTSGAPSTGHLLSTSGRAVAA